MSLQMEEDKTWAFLKKNSKMIWYDLNVLGWKTWAVDGDFIKKQCNNI